MNWLPVVRYAPGSICLAGAIILVALDHSFSGAMFLFAGLCLIP